MTGGEIGYTLGRAASRLDLNDLRPVRMLRIYIHQGLLQSRLQGRQSCQHIQRRGIVGDDIRSEDKGERGEILPIEGERVQGEGIPDLGDGQRVLIGCDGAGIGCREGIEGDGLGEVGAKGGIRGGAGLGGLGDGGLKGEGCLG